MRFRSASAAMMFLVAFFLAVFFLVVLAACTRGGSGEQVVVEIPAGFSGDFVLNMGVKNAAPLARQGDQYVITVDKSGKAITSSLLSSPRVTFKNSSAGSVWGYSHSVFTTGDGIPVGGKIEFFVGTEKEYEAEEGKKTHSRDFPSAAEQVAEL